MHIDMCIDMCTNTFMDMCTHMCIVAGVRCIYSNISVAISVVASFGQPNYPKLWQRPWLNILPEVALLIYVPPPPGHV